MFIINKWYELYLKVMLLKNTFLGVHCFYWIWQQMYVFQFNKDNKGQNHNKCQITLMS